VATAKVASGLTLSFPRHPVQSQRWHQKEEYDYDTQLDEEPQNQPSEFVLVDLKQVRRPRNRSVPKQNRRGKVEQREYKADDECTEEKVPKEDDFFAVHAAFSLTTNGHK
jgi:hypothetical protein